MGSNPACLIKSQFFSISSMREATNKSESVFFSLSFFIVCQKIEYSAISPGKLIAVSQREPLSAASFNSFSSR